MKRILKIGLGILVILFFIGLLLPDVDKEKNINEEKKDNLLQTNSKWFSIKDSKKESLIEKNIVGDWDRVFSVTYDTKSFDKELYNKTKGNFYHEKFTDGMLPKYFYEFKDKQGIKKNKDPLSYAINNTIITFINPLADNETEKVLFIGNGLMVRNAEISSIKLGGFDFYKKANINRDTEFKTELTDFLNSLIFEGGNKIKKAASLINSGKLTEGYSTLSDGVTFIRIASLSDTGMKAKSTELLTGIKNEFSSNFDIYVENEINTLNQEISATSETKADIEYLDKFQSKLRYLNNLKFIASTIGVNISKIDKAYNNVEKNLDSETANLKLYGDGEQGMMKYAAMEYIKNIAKNPNSIDIIKCGVTKRSSKGIIYTVIFRGQNSFGGNSIDNVSVLLNFDIGSRNYFVVRQL